MRHIGISFVTIAAFASRVVVVQQIPLTRASADAEGATFPSAFRGTSERRCVSSVPDDSLPGGSLRSGDFIMRAGLTGRYGLRTGKEHKILWMPLHDPGSVVVATAPDNWGCFILDVAE